MTAFLAPSKIAPESVLPTLDWATEMARSGRVIVSGFSSRLESDVWDVLVRNGSPIVNVLVRKKFELIPMKYRPLLDNGQLLFLFLGLGIRLNRQNAPIRNAYVANLANEVVFPYISEQSSLYSIYKSAITDGKNVSIITSNNE